ncbi:hypothetical protein PI124_g10211 [Phytophthora idaei]|nr:hypothetical protein PI125_g15703 [Phytophthora idaei]KAG3245033.1 hypothetical protein PI124_g10211 [Phytophthora idaei]
MSATSTRKRAHVSDSDRDSGGSGGEAADSTVSVPAFEGSSRPETRSTKRSRDTKRRHANCTRLEPKTRSLNASRRTVAARERVIAPALFDESFEYYTKTVICTYGWKFKPRGTGTRTNHTIRSIGCPAKLNAVLTKDEHDNYTVRVTKPRNVYNRIVNRGVYYSYAEARKITSPGTRSVVKTLVHGGSKQKILRYLKEISGQPILAKDVENLVAKMRKDTYTSEDDNERVAQVLRDFSEGLGNAVNVFCD